MLSNSESTSGVGRTTTACVRWCNVGRFLIAFVPSLLLYQFIPEIEKDLFDTFVDPPPVPESQRDSLLLVERLERLPLSPTFYFLVTVFAEIYLGWRWCSYAKLSREIEGTDITKLASGLTHYDWGVIRGLRNRAFHLRTRSWVMLTGLIFLLFGTIYFVIFILPQVRGRDRLLIEETIFRAKYGHILGPMSQGRYWLKMDAKGLELAEGETIKTARFAPDGRRGIVGSNESSVFFTTDGGRTWRRPAGLTLKRSEREYVARVEFGVSSESMLVVGDEGSVFVPQDGGQSWTPLDGLEGKWITTVSFAPDGRRGIVGSTTNSVLFTKDGGRKWDPLTNLNSKGSEREYVAGVNFRVNNDSRTMLVVGNEGSVFLTEDKGETWKELKKLAEGERISTVSFTPDGQRGIAGSTTNSVFFTEDGGRMWSRLTKLEPEGSEREYVARVEFGFNGDSETMLVVGNEGSVFVTQDKEGQSWTRPGELEGKWIRPRSVRFAPDRRRGIAGNTMNSVFFTTNGGVTWSRLTDLAEKGSKRESVAMVQFGVKGDSKTVLVVGNEGSVFVTRDEGQTWLLTEGLPVTKELVFVLAMQEKLPKERPVDEQNGDGSPSEEKDGSRYSFLMMASDGVYILKTHPVEPEQSLISIQSRVRNDDVLRRSVIGKDILTMSLQESPSLGSNPGEDTTKIWFPIDELTLMRIASMTILFFLVQLLVRLYQYNLRLASFLDSRADAVLLARTFASCKKIPFDDLVRSMAPDDYDFKPQPRPLPGMLKQFLPQRDP